MKRKVGEVIDYHGLKLQVMATDTCRGCYFNRVVKGIHMCCYRDRDVTGECITGGFKTEWVKFVLLGVVG